MLSEASYHNMTVGRIPSVEGGIQPTIVDAKGDLIAAVAADSLNRLAVGSNDQVLVADSAASTGLAWKSYGAQVVAGKNAVINGGFDIWQRNTSIAGANNGTTFTADRWNAYRAVAGSTFTRQVTGDTTNLPNIQYCLRVSRDSGNTATNIIVAAQNVESQNAIPFAGQTVTVSWYARRGANFSAASNNMQYEFITGTGTDQNILSTYTGAVTTTGTKTLTTTWQRFSYTVTLAATATEFALDFYFTPVGTAAAADYFEITGVQVELGSVATTFSRAGGTIQGELAACQRYFEFIGGKASGYPIIGGYATAGISAYFPIAFKASKRISPTVTKVGTWAVGNTGQPSPNYIGVDGFSSLQTATATGAFFTYPDSTDDGFNCDAEL
jgi:hypothetical protein